MFQRLPMPSSTAMLQPPPLFQKIRGGRPLFGAYAQHRPLFTKYSSVGVLLANNRVAGCLFNFSDQRSLLKPLLKPVARNHTPRPTHSFSKKRKKKQKDAKKRKKNNNKNIKKENKQHRHRQKTFPFSLVSDIALMFFALESCFPCLGPSTPLRPTFPSNK